MQSIDTSETLCDNWERHWTDFNAASDNGPATRFRYRLCFRLLGIGDRGEGVRLLDIGSGTGGFAEAFAECYPAARVHGLELSQTGVEMAARRVPKGMFEQRDLMAPIFEGRPPRALATHAVCSEVLEHLDDPAAFLRNAKAYMAPGCRFAVTVPGGAPNAFDLYIGHRRHYTADELRRLLEEAGFVVERATGTGFPFFNLYRVMTGWRGERLKEDVAGRPSLLVRLGSVVFGVLFRFNLFSAGWQTAAVARYGAAR